jgi:hypothetical protein
MLPGCRVASPTRAAASRRKPKRAKALGVDAEEYARRLREQGGGCAICGAKPKTRRLHVDHDHKTGEVRGLLCHRCNRALATWMDIGWLHEAQVYLGRHESKRAIASLIQRGMVPE